MKVGLVILDGWGLNPDDSVRDAVAAAATPNFDRYWRKGAHVLVTADHGNADDMGTAESPHTAHTTNPVPFVYLAPDGTAGGRRVREGGTLADIAPTILALVGIDKPDAMTGESLVD